MEAVRRSEQAKEHEREAGGQWFAAAVRFEVVTLHATPSSVTDTFLQQSASLIVVLVCVLSIATRNLPVSFMAAILRLLAMLGLLPARDVFVLGRFGFGSGGGCPFRPPCALAALPAHGLYLRVRTGLRRRD